MNLLEERDLLPPLFLRDGPLLNLQEDTRDAPLAKPLWALLQAYVFDSIH